MVTKTKKDTSTEQESSDVVKTESKGVFSLTPNVISGYSIVPDQWNWTVVVKKIHGSESKNAGTEYKQPLSYHKNLEHAMMFLYNHVSKTESESEQKKEFDSTGKIASLDAMLTAFKRGEDEVMKAIAELNQKISNLGIDPATHQLNALMLAKNDADAIE